MSVHRAPSLQPKQRAYIRRFCESYIGELRSIMKAAWPDIKQSVPDHKSPCHTCAFNPSTDSWPGFEKTVTGLMFAIEEGKPFYCHEGHPRTQDGWFVDPSKAKLCAGYAVIATEPNPKAAAVKAIRAAGRPPDGVTWDENSGLCYPKT